MHWSRLEIYSAVRDLSHHIGAVTENHSKVMHRVMRYVAGTPSKGWKLKPDLKWDGKYKSFKFSIRGRSHLDYAACNISMRRVIGYDVYLKGSVILVKSEM